MKSILCVYHYFFYKRKQETKITRFKIQYLPFFDNRGSTDEHFSMQVSYPRTKKVAKMVSTVRLAVKTSGRYKSSLRHLTYL